MEAGSPASAFDMANGPGLPGGGAESGTPATPPATPGAQPPATPEQLVEIKWNGKTEKVPLAQAIELAQKGYDYTQKMQQLAKDRESFGGERQRYENAIAEVRAFLQDPKRVEAYLGELRRQAGASAPTGAGDPDTPISQAELEQRLKAAREELVGATQAELAQMRQSLQVEALAGQYSTELGTYVEGLKKQIPELQAIPKVDRILKEEVRQMGPRSMEEAKQMMLAVAQDLSKNVQGFLMEQRKGAAAAAPPAASPLANGIEPKGGGAVLPQSAQHKFKGFSDPAFRAAVIADLEAPSGAR